MEQIKETTVMYDNHGKPGKIQSQHYMLVKASVGSIRNVAGQLTSRARQIPTLSKDGLAKAI